MENINKEFLLTMGKLVSKLSEAVLDLKAENENLNAKMDKILNKLDCIASNTIS